MTPALPLDRMMVGTGAASVADAVALTRHAAELGFAGALVLPPFYYKGVPDDGLVTYIDTIVKATRRSRSRSISTTTRSSPACTGMSRWSNGCSTRSAAASSG